MASPINKMNETSVITHCQKFKGHTDNVWGVIHLPDGQRIITCSMDGSLRVWNLKSGKQIGDDWRDGDSGVMSIALSPDGNKVVSGSWDGIVRLWDIDTCKVITKWMGHANGVGSVCWSRDGRRVLSGSQDGTAKQWDVHSAETILEPIENILASIETRHERVWAVVYSPDTTMIATGGLDGPRTEKFFESSVKIWDAKTGKLIVTLNGHTDAVRCLAWTKDGKTLISGSYDSSIRTWNTTNWEQTAVLEHTSFVYAIAISPNSHILASVTRDKTARLWNLENGQLISSPIQHAEQVNCVSFSADGKRLATGCNDKNAYIWDVTTILREAGLDDLLSDPKANKSALYVHLIAFKHTFYQSNAIRHPIQLRPPPHRVPQGFFNGAPPSHLSAQSRPHSSALSGSTLLERLFRRSPSNTHDTSPSSPPDWAHNLLRWRGQSGKVTELGGCTPAVMEVPYAKGKRRNACAREKRKRPLPPKNTTAGSSHLSKPNVAQPPLQPQAADSSSTTHAIGDATITTGTTSVTSRPDITIRQAGLWTRFWLLICCTSTEYTGDGHH
ncbi:WD40 repeat-like protein [Suillus brevipes Sb2]|nr:WD40 repeat-like protein [Suillus brevipes Sb2]KAG2739656.1 WD40 repeat-like protein [Suillus brevipes Sb2]